MTIIQKNKYYKFVDKDNSISLLHSRTDGTKFKKSMTYQVVSGTLVYRSDDEFYIDESVDLSIFDNEDYKEISREEFCTLTNVLFKNFCRKI